MNRREFLAGGAALAGAGYPSDESERSMAGPDLARVGHRQSSPNISIREYLCREARRTTGESLADLKTPSTIQRTAAGRRRQYMEMMGLASLPAAKLRPPVPCHITGVIDRPAYRIEKLHYESLPDLHVTANLYLPKNPQQ